jgi:hypothetical protein
MLFNVQRFGYFRYIGSVRRLSQNLYNRNPFLFNNKTLKWTLSFLFKKFF